MTPWRKPEKRKAHRAQDYFEWSVRMEGGRTSPETCNIERTSKSAQALQRTTCHKEALELKTPPALMTEAERNRYRRFLAAAEEKLARDRRHLAKLRDRWHLSDAITDGAASQGVATLYSQVRIRDMKSGRTHVQTVVLPTDAEVFAGRRALSSWSGPMLLGAREGDEIEWISDEVLQQLRIEEVLHQPQTVLSDSPAQTPRAVRADSPAVTDMTHLAWQRNEKSRRARIP